MALINALNISRLCLNEKSVQTATLNVKYFCVKLRNGITLHSEA